MPADRGGLLLESTGHILGVLSESLKCPCHLLITKALKQPPANAWMLPDVCGVEAPSLHVQIWFWFTSS